MMIRISKSAAFDLMSETDLKVYQQELDLMQSWAEQNGKRLDLEFYLDDSWSIILYFKSNGQKAGEIVRFNGEEDMKMSKKNLEEFGMNLHCPSCEQVTDHLVSKMLEFDNDNVGCIYYFAECEICENAEEYLEEDLYGKDEI